MWSMKLSSKIYLDMDGVLVDFDKGLLDNFGVQNCLITYGTADKDKTPEQWAISNKVWECMNTPKFFRSLPPMEGFKELWEAANKLTRQTYILTAFPNTENNKQVGRDKWDWIQEYLPEVTSDKFIFCERKDKVQYATYCIPEGRYTPGASFGGPNILVDDLLLNCQEWERAGGQSVLFKDKTMNQVIWSMEVAYGV